ncbi:MAG: hypothetical protein NTW96_00515 [Planctomycetia bacterium]|nr:hypothetical protein [Planctomycetia bacterium]
MGDYGSGLAAMAWAQLWQVTVVALAVGAIALPLGRRRPHLAYVLWLLVVVKCLTPPVWSSPLGVFSWAHGPISGRAEVRLQPANSTLPPQQPVASRVVAEVDRDRSGNAAEWPNPLAATAETPAPEPGMAAPPETEQSKPSWSPWSDRFSASALLAVAWLLGAAVYLTVAIIRMLRWESAVRRARPPGDGPLVDLVGRLSARLGVRRKVAVRITAEALGPAVVGTVRPAVLLPEVLVSNRSSEQLEPIVAHELIHIRRYDAAVGALQVLAQCLWWFHPLVWWVNRAVCRERERCCDAEAVGSLGCPPEKYAQGLLDVLRLERHLAPAVGMPGMYPYQITRMRLETVMNPAIRVHCRTPRGYWLVFAAGLLLSLPGVEATGEAEPPASSPSATNSTAADSRTVAPPSVRPVKTLSGHAGAVCSVAVSPNGKILASAGVDDSSRPTPAAP